MIHRKFNIRNFVVIIAASVLLTVIYTIMSKYIDNLLNIIIMYIGQTAVLKLVEKTDKNEVLMIKNLMANAIVYLWNISSNRITINGYVWNKTHINFKFYYNWNY